MYISPPGDGDDHDDKIFRDIAGQRWSWKMIEHVFLDFCVSQKLWAVDVRFCVPRYIYSGGWEARWARWAVRASKIWFSTLRPLPGSYALPTWWVSNIGCCGGVICVLGGLGVSGVVFGAF